MITITEGNLLKADAEALVNTVNCVGHMGKGIALQFKKAFPENYEAYRKACAAEEVQPGSMFIYVTGTMFNPRYIINFPTKRHWRGNSRYEDIESGLQALVAAIQRLDIHSVAVPPLGCGLGGLSWPRVHEMIKAAFAGCPDIEVHLFAPGKTPPAQEMPVKTKRPHLTVARALFVKIMATYSRLSYRLTLLEIQKLAYFLQEAGEPLQLKYEEGVYGPYAHNLNKVLEILEGHFTTGYGDTQKPDVEISLLPHAIEEADVFLADYEESRCRLENVAQAIEGFETPYGMELLSSIHWVVTHHEPAAKTAEEAVKVVQNWNERKRKLFSEKHLHMAWDRLSESGWLNDVKVG